MFTKVPLYQKEVVDGEEVLKHVGDLVIYHDHVMILYNSRIGNLDVELQAQDTSDFESMEQFFDSRRLWMSNTHTVGINFQTNVVSVSFARGKKPTYFFLDERELTLALDSMGAFSALLTH